MTMQRTLRLFKLPDKPEVPGFRKLVVEDVAKAHKLLEEVSFCVPNDFSFFRNHNE